MLNLIPFSDYPPPHKSWKQVASELPPELCDRILTQFGDEEAGLLHNDFYLNARREQLPPFEDWFVWIILAGRGFGKTFSGANWIIDKHMEGVKLSAIVAATAADLRRYCIDGPSGIINQAPPYFMPRYIASKTRLEWPDGGMTHLYTSEKPNRLRGANHEIAWCDEVSYWAYMRETWDQLMLTLRHGRDTQCMVTMTPRPVPLVKELLEREGEDVVVTRGSTLDNKDNLAPNFVTQLKIQYEGTRLERQEIFGELLMDAEGALWNHEMIDKLRNLEPVTQDKIVFRVVAVDPSTTAKEGSDECGIVVASKESTGVCNVEHDLSRKCTPHEWAQIVVNAWENLDCNLVVAEKNQGGQMVEDIIHSINKHIPVKLVHAAVGKVARAEPIALEYERGRVHHRGAFHALEDEMCAFVPGDIIGSPNRVDALVWGLTELLITRGGRAGTWGKRIRDMKTRDKGLVPPVKVKRRSYRVRLG